MAIDPSGMFVFTANQQTDNVSAFTLNSTSGALTPVAGSPFAAGSSPWAKAVDPKGQFVYETNRSGDSVSAYTLNVTNGTLTPVAGSPYAAGTGPGFMVFTP